MAGRHSSPAELFDAAADPERDGELLAQGLELVARPGMAAPSEVGGDAFAIRRAIGEDRRALVYPVTRVVDGRAALEADGVACEGCEDGVFLEVGRPHGGRRSALRIASPEGLLSEDTVLLQPVPARRHAEPPSGAASGAAREMEAVTDPIRPPRAPLAIRGTVGRGGQNQAPDVIAVQERLVELRALDATDAAAERPAATGAVAETSLVKTIEAIERFEGQVGGTPNGRVELRGATRTDLDRAVPHPTAAELAAVTTERGGVRESVSRGLSITGAVGATAAGNAPADVRAVQARLVELRRLSASHREGPAAVATAPVPQSSLRATIAALRAFQSDVRFWVGRGAVRGAVTSGVVAPGDATASLLAQVSVHTIGTGASQVVLRDHVVSGATQSEAGVAFLGTALPSAIPVSDYQAQGLTSPGQAAALKMVSTHEGNFDAINTYDRAQVSVGFIQFAGGRGLPPYLALLKARQPGMFRERLQKLGVDVEFAVSGGGIAGARVVVLDPKVGRVLRAAAAEAAIRDDKKLTAALVVSGRHRDVQLVQIEAAIRDYVRPALAAAVAWPGGRATLGEIFRSQKGMAALFDRAIQEGLGGAQRRFERVLSRFAKGMTLPAPRAAPSLPDLRAHEGDLLAELERDLQAGADIAAAIARARAALATLVAAARAQGATVAALVARSELGDARRAVAEARAALPGIVNVGPAGGSTVDATIAAMSARLAAEGARLALTPAPGTAADLATVLEASRGALATVASPVATAPVFLARIQRIRRSTLDSGLGEVA